MPIRVRDLPDLIGAPYPHPMLYCETCGAKYSATRGDYFMARPDTILTCDACGQPMRLVTKCTVYEDWSLDADPN